MFLILFFLLLYSILLDVIAINIVVRNCTSDVSHLFSIVCVQILVLFLYIVLENSIKIHFIIVNILIKLEKIDDIEYKIIHK